MTDMKKQISLVLLTSKDFDEYNLIKDFEKLILKYEGLELVGTHIKKIEVRENQDNR